MIIDRIENASQYYSLGENYQAAFQALEALFHSPIPTKESRVELNGKQLFYSIQLVQCQAPDSNAYEAHQKYADIQFVLDGCETIGWANTAELKQHQSYDDDRDIAWYAGEGTMLHLTRGYFAIFFPDDAHMPCRTEDSAPRSVCKAVAKIRIE